MSKRTAVKSGKVLKEFSALKEQQRISLAAFGVYQLVFRGELIEEFKPKDGTQLLRVWKAGKLSRRQQEAWKAFRRDVEDAIGKSGGVVSSYGEQVGERDPRDKFLVAFTNAAYDRVDYICNRYLMREDRTLLHDLLQDDLQSSGNLKLEFIGLLRSGYADEESARIAAVVNIQTLLDRLAAFYL